jgi:hypothetical protein
LIVRGQEVTNAPITAAPDVQQELRRRLRLHVRTARLWLPEETRWWVKEPRLRPLYGWIRELYQQDGRLPMMIVHHMSRRRRA